MSVELELANTRDARERAGKALLKQLKGILLRT